jgi:cyclic pyranopterin phosphate synthase
MPAEGVSKLDHEDILRYEEILRIARISVRMGISKIRITGGEPLVRKDILYLCSNISQIQGLKCLSLTTNGVLLPGFARKLFAAGISRINISLDTLDPAKYATITRMDAFKDVWRGILAAREAGIAPIKLNAVILRGINDDEIENLAHLTMRHPFHVRFIELMPFELQVPDCQFVSSDEILARLSAVAPLVPVPGPEGNGPAKHYTFSGALGTIGLISPISHHFCATCNRLRFTADGKLRTCLFSADESDIKSLLRGGASDKDIIECVRLAIEKKPERHALGNRVVRKCISRPMFSIGG